MVEEAGIDERFDVCDEIMVRKAEHLSIAALPPMRTSDPLCLGLLRTNKLAIEAIVNSPNLLYVAKEW